MLDLSISVLIRVKYPDREVVHLCRLSEENGELFAYSYLPTQDESLVRFPKTKIDPNDLLLVKGPNGENQYYDYPHSLQCP